MLAAYREIAERGFEGLRTREVAAEVGVNIATDGDPPNSVVTTAQTVWLPTSSGPLLQQPSR